MALGTYSKFYYGQVITEDNLALDFSEGGPELNATIDIGEYTLSTLGIEIARALNQVGALNYSVSVDRIARKYTITADGPFELLVATGSRSIISAYGTIGFTGGDRTGLSSYQGDSASGSEYSPQFKLQDYVSKATNNSSVEAVVNKSTSGQVEVIAFGGERFYKFNNRFITNVQTGSVVIRDSLTGLEDAIAWMDYLITKAPFEFMPDEDDLDTFDIVLLESTGTDRNGTAYELRELTGQGLANFYETGQIVLRVIE